MKQKLMERLPAVAVFLLLVLGMAGACIALNDATNSIENGSVLSDPLQDELYLLRGVEEGGDGRYYFSVTLPGGAQYALLFNDLAYGIRLDGVTLRESTGSRQPPSFEVLPLPEGASDEALTLRFEFVTNEWENGVNVYLTTATGAFRYQGYYHLLFAFGLGVFCIVALCAGMLYRYKHSESYLAWFALYAGMLALWSVLTLPSMESSGLTWLTGHMYSWTTILNVRACYKLFEKGLPEFFRKLCGGWGTANTLVLFTLGDSLLSAFAMQLVRHCYLLLGCVIALWACWKKQREGYFILVGMALSQGVRLVLLLGNFPQFPITFWLVALRYAKIINSSFSMAYMAGVCRTFGLKFGEAEKLAAELEQANHGLDQKVEERTLALREEQRQRRALMMNVFHDLRTPLFIVKGGLEAIIAQEEPPKKETLEAMRGRLDFAAKLTEDLFLSAKLENHKVLMETEVVRFCALVGRVTDAHAIACREKDITLNVSIQKGMRVFGDEKYLEQAVQNLLTNAVEYAGKGGAVWVNVAREGGEVVASVRDSGPGIPQEELPYIFQRYYTVGSTRKSSSTGLGLSIAREIAREHRGRIEVKSEVGVGTEFRLCLPAIETGPLD